MSKRRFTTAQIEELSKNKNVSKCSDKLITYSKEFKVFAVRRYFEEGCSPAMIFKEAGFDRQLIGKIFLTIVCSVGAKYIRIRG